MYALEKCGTFCFFYSLSLCQDRMAYGIKRIKKGLLGAHGYLFIYMGASFHELLTMELIYCVLLAGTCSWAGDYSAFFIQPYHFLYGYQSSKFNVTNILFKILCNDNLFSEERDDVVFGKAFVCFAYGGLD